MTIDVEEFTSAMSRVPGPVTVATTIDRSGRRWGFTASSFISLSLQPPLVLICLDKQASTHAAFASARHFMINILAKEQSGVAVRFATSGIDRFAAGDTEPAELGLPGISEAAARVACSMHQLLDGGDHTILVGRVEEAHVGDQAPLVYCDRVFGRHAELNAPEAMAEVR
ncbi:flavin reductase [Spongiactinospora rosea]|uniref:Flavin reductase n=1 Tax=Spongiactinospora rosea TaxID=2248750 RepID=A0A366LSR8_9ACTN|nr:flavin reductase family protein [Spongiactinospora rosea]RBQ16797.1 flavin reductase [Spongiactinospora rosea]